MATDNTPPVTVTYRYTSPQFAQDCRSLARLKRRDRRIESLRRLASELVWKAVAPSIALALITILLH